MIFILASLFVQLSPCLDPPRQTSLLTCFQAGRDTTKNSIYSTWETEWCICATSWSMRQKYSWLKVMTKSWHPPSDSEWTLVTCWGNLLFSSSWIEDYFPFVNWPVNCVQFIRLKLRPSINFNICTPRLNIFWFEEGHANLNPLH